MFFYFFEEYRETTYKGFRRKLEWNNIFIILVTIASAIPSFIALSKKHWIIASYLVALPFALIGGILIFADLRLKKNRSKMLSEYKKSHIKPLCTQLKSFNLYNDAGIDWLIECCKEKKQKSKDFYPLSSMMHFVMNAIYPLITLGIGLVLNNCTTNEVIEFIAVIIVMFLVGGGLIICLKPIVHSLLFFDEPIVDYLLDDLTYLKTQDKIEQIVRN